LQSDPADFGHSGGIPRRNCATRVQAARRHPGEVAARWRSQDHGHENGTPIDNAQVMDAAPSLRQAPARAADIGRREARYATQPAHAEVLPDATAPRACRLRVGVPVKWKLDDAPG